MNKDVMEETEMILKNMKFITIYIQQKEEHIKKIKDGDRGAIKAVCNDMVKSSPTHAINRPIENEVIRIDDLIAKVEGDIFEHKKNRKVISEAFKSMSEKQRKIFKYIYFEEKTLKDIAEEFDCTIANVHYMKKKIIEKMAVALFGQDVLKGEEK